MSTRSRLAFYRLISAFLLLGFAAVFCAAQIPPDLKRNFQTPPDSARPWVYWFWLNGNITREGITADLEAMQRVGIGGVLIMEVDQGAPQGPAAFAGPKWRELFKHVCTEAEPAGPGSEHEQRRRLVRQRRPVDHARAVDAEGRLDGDACPRAASISRERSPSRRPSPNYYRDIAVLAFPTPAGNARIGTSTSKAGYVRVWTSTPAAPAVWPRVPAGPDDPARPPRRPDGADGPGRPAGLGRAGRASGRSCASATRRPARTTTPRRHPAAGWSATS